MLATLRIQNMALIPAVEINFGPHFNVLTGETGAGKSIIIGSLNFIFGDKLSTTVIRSGADFAKVTAVFDETIITRTLHANGRSEIRVNDEPVTLKGLRAVASQLIDVHGQHDTEKLLDPKNHLAMLDAFGQVDLTAYQTAYTTWQDLQKQLASFGTDANERERLLDLYRYQIEEIKRVNLGADEEETLNNQVTVLRHAEKIATGLDEVINHLDSADVALSRAGKTLTNLETYDPQLSPLATRLSVAAGEVTDILLELRDYLERADFSATSLDELYQRLDEIKNLKRKYGANYDAIMAFLAQTEAEWQRLTNATAVIADLQQQIAAQAQVVTALAAALTAARQAAATQLAAALRTHLADLGMPNAQFSVQITPCAPQRDGADTVEFYFSANLGEAVRPLAQIISGGEMSRLMLAMKTVANTTPDKTLVFDEIDTGISGQTGAALAAKLAGLAQNSQIIVVTHLATVAAAADKHYLIQKNITNEKTITNVYPLTPDARLAEVARMIGGGATAQAHAAALLAAHQA